MKNVLIIAILAILFSGCTNKDDAKKALVSSGFSDIQITGYNFFGCSKDDFYHTGFTAKNVKGLEVSGTVCSGLFFKNSTIRF